MNDKISYVDFGFFWSPKPKPNGFGFGSESSTQSWVLAMSSVRVMVKHTAQHAQTCTVHYHN